jgi:hypothetical protein
MQSADLSNAGVPGRDLELMAIAPGSAETVGARIVRQRGDGR